MVNENYWPTKFDRAKELLGLKSDSALANWLGIAPFTLYRARSGEKELGAEYKIRLQGLLEGPINEHDFLQLLPLKTRDAVLDGNIDVFDPESGISAKPSPDFWLACIDRVKQQFDVKSDAALARSLSISQSRISAVNTGTGELDLVAKFRILDKLGYAASRQLLADLLPRSAREAFLSFDNSRFKRRKRRRASANKVVDSE